MKIWQRVIAAHEAEPHLPAVDIARKLDADPTYVRVVGYRKGLNLPRCRRDRAPSKIPRHKIAILKNAISNGYSPQATATLVGISIRCAQMYIARIREGETLDELDRDLRKPEPKPKPKPVSLAWTAEEDNTLKALWHRFLAPEIAKRIKGRSSDAIRHRAHRLGLKRVRYSAVFEPSRDEWVQAAVRRAKEANLDPGLLLAGAMGNRLSLARWKAWRDIMDALPNCSLAGLGRVSGFDHTSVRYGLARLAGETRQQIFGVGK